MPKVVVDLENYNKNARVIEKLLKSYNEIF